MYPLSTGYQLISPLRLSSPNLVPGFEQSKLTISKDSDENVLPHIETSPSPTSIKNGLMVNNCSAKLILTNPICNETDSPVAPSISITDEQKKKSKNQSKTLNASTQKRRCKPSNDCIGSKRDVSFESISLQKGLSSSCPNTSIATNSAVSSRSTTGKSIGKANNFNTERQIISNSTRDTLIVNSSGLNNPQKHSSLSMNKNKQRRLALMTRKSHEQSDYIGFKFQTDQEIVDYVCNGGDSVAVFAGSSGNTQNGRRHPVLDICSTERSLNNLKNSIGRKQPKRKTGLKMEKTKTRFVDKNRPLSSTYCENGQNVIVKKEVNNITISNRSNELSNELHLTSIDNVCKKTRSFPDLSVTTEKNERFINVQPNVNGCLKDFVENSLEQDTSTCGTSLMSYKLNANQTDVTNDMSQQPVYINDVQKGLKNVNGICESVLSLQSVLRQNPIEPLFDTESSNDIGIDNACTSFPEQTKLSESFEPLGCINVYQKHSSPSLDRIDKTNDLTISNKKIRQSIDEVNREDCVQETNSRPLTTNTSFTVVSNKDIKQLRRKLKQGERKAATSWVQSCADKCHSASTSISTSSNVISSHALAATSANPGKSGISSKNRRHKKNNRKTALTCSHQDDSVTKTTEEKGKQPLGKYATFALPDDIDRCQHDKSYGNMANSSIPLDVPGCETNTNEWNSFNVTTITPDHRINRLVASGHSSDSIEMSDCGKLTDSVLKKLSEEYIAESLSCLLASLETDCFLDGEQDGFDYNQTVAYLEQRWNEIETRIGRGDSTIIIYSPTSPSMPSPSTTKRNDISIPCAL